MLINAPVGGEKGTYRKWCMLAGYPPFEILNNKGSPFGFYTVGVGWGGEISQSSLRHLSNYSFIEPVPMTVLWVPSTPCALR